MGFAFQFNLVPDPEQLRLESCFSCCSAARAWCNASWKVLADGSTFSCHFSHKPCTKNPFSASPCCSHPSTSCVHSYTQTASPNLVQTHLQIRSVAASGASTELTSASPVEPLLPSHSSPSHGLAKPHTLTQHIHPDATQTAQAFPAQSNTPAQHASPTWPTISLTSQHHPCHHH